MTLTQKITPCLWFDGNAETAIDHYLSIFKGGRIVTVTRCGAGPGPKGSVLIATFEIAGQHSSPSMAAHNSSSTRPFLADRAVARRASHQRSRSGEPHGLCRPS